ncbi:MAG: class I adenylate-forming enzyme family protein [Vicinamibacteraceae bacterium]
MQVEEFLEHSAQQLPDKTALVVGDRRVSYAELDRLANCVAHSLVQQGVRRGDRVAIYLESSVEAVASIFGALKAGGVFMPINSTTKADKLAFVLNNSRAAAVVTDGKRCQVLDEAKGRTPHLRVTLVAGSQRVGPAHAIAVSTLEDICSHDEWSSAPPRKRSIDIDLAALIYTSGSTGNPKGVMLTHLNMVAAATSITTYLENTSDDIVLNVLPLSFDYGLYQVLMAFKVGATVVLERSFAYPHAVLDRLIHERVTGFPIVPTISAILLQLDLSAYDLSSLRYVTNTGAALPTHHITELRRLLPRVRLYSMYGLTECKRVAYLPPEEVDARPSSVGQAMPNVEVYLVDEQGNRLDAGVGELVIRGSNVMKGYWEMPEETDRVLKPGPLPGERVLYSGDLFRMDEEGYLYFVGRKDEIIKTRGEKVSPREVENALTSLDGIAEAAVVGIPDPVLGQAIKAVVTLKSGAALTEQQIMRHCAQRLEDFMVPRSVEIREALPQTSTGKVAKKALAV